MGLMSRVRWGLAGALALVAFVAAIQALRTYLAHQMTVGVLAVAALVVTLAVGLFSLGSARRRIEQELAGLRAASGAGELFLGRRKRLEAIKKAGARADRDALADATAAGEAGRAYIGRYLVATTVLMGLVGTFAGLMETLGRIAPLLGEQEARGLALLAAPLAGLHVTFGASLVAILATLALALAQGDLTLHEELALAMLEDRTTHELIPALWPPADEPAERTLRAVGDLKDSLASALVKALEKSGNRIAENARTEGERGARALEATATTVGKELLGLGQTVIATAAESARKQGEVLAAAVDAATQSARQASESATRIVREAGAETTARTAKVVEDVLRRSAATSDEAVARTAKAAAEAVRATTAALEGTLQPLFNAEAARLDGVRAALLEATAGIEAASARLGAVDAGMATLAREHLAAIDRAGTAVLAGFDRAVVGGGAALEQAATSLAAAAGDLRAGAEAFAPRIAALTTELAALGREVALLAAREPENELGAVVLTELERLGAGVDRLTELLRLGEPIAPAPVVPATAEES